MRCMRRQWMRMALGVLLCGGVLIGSGIATERAEAQTRGGMLRVSVPGSPRLLDPPITGAGEEWLVTSWLYSNLTRIAPDLSVQSDLAVSWESAKGASEWTFKLHPDVKFHHGRTVTAEDVVFSINRILDPKTASRGKGPIGPISKVEALDPLTVRFTLSTPVADFPANLALPYARIIPKEKVADLNAQAFGTGPFMLKEYVVGDHVTVVRNPNYFRKGKPLVDEVRLQVFPDPTAELNSLLSGNTDIMWQVRVEQVALLKRDSNVQVAEAVTGAFTPIVMRADRPPFNDNRVRQALKYCFDREKILQVITQGHGTIGNDFSLPPNNPFAPALPVRKRDYARAKALLAEAGHPSGLKLKMYTSDARVGMLELAVLAKEMCQPAGFDIEIVKVTWDVFLNTVWEKETFYVNNWFARPTTDTSIFPFFATRLKGGTLNEYGYSNGKLDDVLLKAKGETNTERRKQLYREAAQVLVEDGPAVIPYFKNYISAVRSAVQGFVINPTQTLNVEDLWLKR